MYWFSLAWKTVFGELGSGQRAVSVTSIRPFLHIYTYLYILKHASFLPENIIVHCMKMKNKRL